MDGSELDDASGLGPPLGVPEPAITRAHGGGADAGPAGVGSNATQPAPWKYSSGQACASFSPTTWLPWPVALPDAKPTATRAGMSSIRAITAIVDANCTQ